jgi:hypothetical protein
MRKVIVIGSPGAGKTTFSNTLGSKLGIPVHYLDKYFWKENWTPTPQADFLKIQDDLMSGDKWIIDGNYLKSINHRIPNADTIIFFDFPKIINLWRTFKRFFWNFGTIRLEMGGGNKEALHWKHLKFIATFPRKEVYRNIMSLAENRKVIVFSSPREVSQFLQDLQS